MDHVEGPQHILWTIRDLVSEIEYFYKPTTISLCSESATKEDYACENKFVIKQVSNVSNCQEYTNVLYYVGILQWSLKTSILFKSLILGTRWLSILLKQNLVLVLY